jgi:hypothetical protein
MLWSIVMSVALDTDHRSVDACPRSMLRGSAVKLAIAGLGGGGGVSTFGGGGGGGGGTFFLQPAVENIITMASSTALACAR